MEIPEKILDALHRKLAAMAEENHGDGKGLQKKLAAEIGVKPNYVSRWLNRRVGIGVSMWRKLEPVLRPFLPEGYNPFKSSITPQQRPQPPSPTVQHKLFDDLSRTLSKLAPGHQIVTGVINVGIPNEKIVQAIASMDLPVETKLELQKRIFS